VEIYEQIEVIYVKLSALKALIILFNREHCIHMFLQP